MREYSHHTGELVWLPYPATKTGPVFTAAGVDFGQITRPGHNGPDYYGVAMYLMATAYGDECWQCEARCQNRSGSDDRTAFRGNKYRHPAAGVSGQYTIVYTLSGE